MKRSTVSLLLFTIFCHADQMQEAFTQVFKQNFWADQESLSGPGSNLKQTAILRYNLELFFELFEIKTVIDAACGDFNWMKEISYPLKQYIGIDIVPDLITHNNAKYGDDIHSFYHKNIVKDLLPKVDVIICRDCFVHLRFDDITTALRNFKKSGSKYVLMTTFRKKRPNTEVARYGFWRTLNMELPPFNLPEPILYIDEGCTESNPDDSFDDKCLGLWRLADLDI